MEKFDDWKMVLVQDHLEVSKEEWMLRFVSMASFLTAMDVIGMSIGLY